MKYLQYPPASVLNVNIQFDVEGAGGTNKTHCSLVTQISPSTDSLPLEGVCGNEDFKFRMRDWHLDRLEIFHKRKGVWWYGFHVPFHILDVPRNKCRTLLLMVYDGKRVPPKTKVPKPFVHLLFTAKVNIPVSCASNPQGPFSSLSDRKPTERSNPFTSHVLWLRKLPPASQAPDSIKFQIAWICTWKRALRKGVPAPTGAATNSSCSSIAAISY